MMDEREGQKIAIIGAARQGIALARYLVEHGAQVILNDKRPQSQLSTAQEALADLPITWILGGHPFTVLEGIDLLCLSGGVPLYNPLVVEAVRRGIPLSNDSQIFLEVTPCKVIGITGSAGKTTTTTLVGRIAQFAVENDPSAKQRVWLGGNIGNPLITVVDQMSKNDIAIVELSSFQLEIMTLSPQIAAILNLTPNHLDRHGTMEAYVAAKRRILDYQSSEDAAILWRDDERTWGLHSTVKGRLHSFGLTPLPRQLSGAFLKKDAIYIKSEDSEEYLFSKDSIKLRGSHNLLNILAACTIVSAAGLTLSAIKPVVESFYGVAHRLEFVRNWHGADWYNDSIATAPERAIAAIQSFNEPLIVLIGGRDKQLPWDEFASLVHQRVDHLILFGEMADLVDKAITKAKYGVKNKLISVRKCRGLKDAIQIAAELAQPGYVVLLAPGGTSFDEFKDFEERGERFRQWVNELP